MRRDKYLLVTINLNKQKQKKDLIKLKKKLSQVTTTGGRVKYRQVQLEVVTPEALILGKEEYHIQQGGSFYSSL
jgi:hypothetical protein